MFWTLLLQTDLALARLTLLHRGPLGGCIERQHIAHILADHCMDQQPAISSTHVAPPLPSTTTTCIMQTQEARAGWSSYMSGPTQ